MTQNFEKEILEFGEEIAKGYGFSGIGSKIFITLFLEPGKIGLDELSNKLGYSMSTLSTNMKLFENFGCIKKIKEPGSKKIYFLMEKNILQIMLSKLEKVKQIEIDPVKKKIPKILEKYKPELKENNNNLRFKKQYKIIEKYLTQMSVVDKMISKLIKEIEEL